MLDLQSQTGGSGWEYVVAPGPWGEEYRFNGESKGEGNNDSESQSESDSRKNSENKSNDTSTTGKLGKSHSHRGTEVKKSDCVFDEKTCREWGENNYKIMKQCVY